MPWTETLHGADSADVAYVVDLTVQRRVSEDGSFELRVALTLVDKLGQPSRSRTVLCDGVATLALGDLVPRALFLLEVEDVRGDQHEGVAYRVRDAENAIIDLRCRSVSVSETGAAPGTV